MFPPIIGIGLINTKEAEDAALGVVASVSRLQSFAMLSTIVTSRADNPPASCVVSVISTRL